MSVAFNTLNLTSVQSYLESLEEYLGYLEKSSASNLGDFTTLGKSINAGYGNYTVYWDWYKLLTGKNLQTNPYCACFVSVTLARAFGLEKAKKLLCGDLFIYCPDGYDRFKAKGRIYKDPKPGDVVLFWSDSLDRWGHVGVVVNVDKAGYTTIEANTTAGNNTLVRNGGATCRKYYNHNSRKVAFCRPDYESLGISYNKAPQRAPEVSYPISTGQSGLKVVSDVQINTDYRESNTKGSVKAGEIVYPSKKVFNNGIPYYYDQNRLGWIDARNLSGWVKEGSGKWWWLDKNYTYPVNRIKEIDGQPYYFGADGFVLIGNIVISTDSDGVLKMSTGRLV